MRARCATASSADLAQTREQVEAVRTEMARDEAQLLELDQLLQRLAPELQTAREAERATAESLEQAETALSQWQDDWHAYNLGLKEIQQTAQLEQARVEHLTAQIGQIQRQNESLLQERERLSIGALDERLALQASASESSEARTQALQSRLDALAHEAGELRQLELQHGAELETLTRELSLQKGQVSAMQAVQRAALGADDSALADWLAREDLTTTPRLAQRLRVAAPWLLAVETVLGDFLQAVCVGDFDRHLTQVPDTQFILIDGSAGQTPARDDRSLLAHVADPGAAAALLADVLTASDLSEAVRLRRELGSHQSVVTSDGIWLGPGWVRVNRGQRSAMGVLQRENELRDLHQSIERHAVRINAVGEARAATRTRLAEITGERSALTLEFNAANRDHAESVTMLQNLRGEIQRTRDRHAGLDRQIERIGADIQSLTRQLAEANQRADHARIDLDALDGRRPDLQRSQEELLATCNDRRGAAEQRRADASRLSIDFEGRRVARESLSATMNRLQQQMQQYGVRAAQLQEQSAVAEPAIANMQSELSVHLERQLEVDRSLAAQREALEQVESGLRASEAARVHADRAVAAVREITDGLRLQVREFEVRRETVAANFAATEAVLDDVLRDMPQEAEAARWQESLDDVRRRIDRLGPINLAAIEQFNEQSERKKYLDAQNDDLAAALDTLEQAIRKIDRETRTRFQETFDNVNQGLKRIFPRLFGGGHAYLSLEGDDVLSAGVTVMARPPGKRNSHIHLLSGGEKALTAVSLIFSIFELNPAPFCLLDEVDAPLDEANVSRFCDIVREMSERVQFVVITHNKTTMEMVHQLTGVTMNEPGVSRLVSVDLDSAVQLAAS